MAIVVDSRTHALDSALYFAVPPSLWSLVRKEAFDDVKLKSTAAVDSDEEWGPEVYQALRQGYQALRQGWVRQDNDWVLLRETPDSPETGPIPSLQQLEAEVGTAWIDPEAQQFGYSLIELLTMQPVDEGYEHPGEQLIADSLSSKPSIAPYWIQRVYREKEDSNPVLAGEILKCIAQLASLDDPEWGIRLALRGLDSSEIQLREAALRVFESWGDSESRHRLTDYISKETASWLADYALEVLEAMRSKP